ncbi:protein tyrosine phosphatase [Grosmannia clavigera kw1407]|uniref:protein-tyrosine-phosphatase n=1 Tax=Grosmannia clavigera (strain kw1407 / UAMH 11150) TaxID=655863 RepID=F0X769_GROCL|nr:protein tyrosine phosphatase [Grosmannia clavigera kw1407]EFX06625.1 protein tyrosine phosphatase [Grosmannia clavigera kw1407]
MHSDPRGSERTVHFTMTAVRSAPPIAHSSPHANPYHGRGSISGAPMSSPMMVVHNVGQPYPPKQSPCSSSLPPSVSTVQEGSSPCYFGLVVEQASDPRDSAVAPRDNWSPPTSSVKSFGAAMQNPFMSLDANPAYDAFRVQVEANQMGRMFAFGGVGTPQTSTDVRTPPIMRSKPLRSPNHKMTPSWETNVHGAKMARSAASPVPSSPMHVDAETRTIGTPSRNLEPPLDSSVFPNLPRYESPAQVESATETRSTLSPVEDRHPRLSLTLGRSSLCTMRGGAVARADSAPIQVEEGPEMMDAAQLKSILETHEVEKSLPLLLLDVRVSTYYAASRIRGALNLCIPTTLLKRATFNLQKLQQTFAQSEDQAKFAAWREARYLVVYDSSSVEKRDATSATNMLRKFTVEGYTGKAYVLRGGFAAFEAAFPQFIDRQLSSMSSGCSTLSLGAAGKKGMSIAPIIGGVMLPSSSISPAPFFSNIRQNMDLADGVGRLRVSLPAGLDPTTLPLWLREATEVTDQGNRVSERFLRIELAEQSRMKNAYSVFNTSVGVPGGSGKVQLSGIEKGIKNRYKDILPFEHARVRLHGRSEGTCDYINASHIRAGRSLKRYIASQGPLPATFEDFWSVVWDQDVRVIVMLTAESEGGQLKCHPYWTGREYGPIRLRMLSERKVSLDMDKRPSPAAAAAGMTESSSTHGDDASTAESGRRRATTLACVGGSAAAPTLSGPSRPGFPLGASANQSETPFVIIRKFSLSHSNHAFQPIREVTQLHYSSWPDFGAPAQPSHLLAIIQLANAMQGPSSPVDGPAAMSPPSLAARLHGSGESWKLNSFSMPRMDEPESDADVKPMLVHCSAGCGRTGTFCTVDAVIDMIKRQHQVAGKGHKTTMGQDPTNGMSHIATRTENTVDAGNISWLENDSVDLVAKTVEDFRTQRLSMVQSLRQFVLCYETVAEWISKTQEHQSVRSKGPGRARSESVRMQG